MSVKVDEISRCFNKDDVTRISRKNRKILNEISIATGNTTDVKLFQEYNSTTSDYARGYLSGVANSGSSQKVLLAYFILKMLMGANQ